MIEINLDALSKSETRVSVKGYPTSKGYVKPHIRTIKTAAQADAEMDVKLATLQMYKEAETRTNDWIRDNPDRHVDVGEVNNYCVDSYSEINHYLRHGKLRGVDNTDAKRISDKSLMDENEVIDATNRISNFLHDAPSFTGNAYRGIFFKTETEEGLKNFNNFIKYVKGHEEIELKGFTSTSSDVDEAKKCVRRSKPGNIIFEIRSKNGVVLGDAARFKSEREVLFNKASKFKIINIDIGEMTYIKLKEI